MSANYMKRVELEASVDTLDIMVTEVSKAFENNQGVEFYQSGVFVFDYDATEKNDVFTEEEMKDSEFYWHGFIADMLEAQNKGIDSDGNVETFA